MSEQTPGDRVELLEDAADDLERYRTEHIVPCMGYERYEKHNTELVKEVKALHALAGETPLLEAVVAATRALTRWAREHSCEECEERGLFVACDLADYALRKLDAHRREAGRG